MAESWLHGSLENHNGSLGMIRRAAILKVDDSGPQQLVNLQGLASDMPMNVVRVLPHGFSSNPPLQSEGILKSLGGRSDRGMFIGGEHPQYRQRNLPSGNAVLYDDKGNVVWMQGAQGIARTTKQGGIVDTSAQGVTIEAKGNTITIVADNFDIIVNPKANKVYLGGDPAKDLFALVETAGGTSVNVYAKIG
jgi:phage gp45-like